MEENPSSSPEVIPPKKRRLTKKQAKLARERVKNPDATLLEIGEKAGYSAPSKTHRALEAEHVQDRIRRLMDANPALTTAALTRKLADGLEAKKTIYATFEGAITETMEVDDKPTQHRYLETAAEWRGIAEKRIRVEGDDAPRISAADAFAILAMAQSLAEPES